MTVAEDIFFQRVPERLSRMERHLEKISNTLERLADVAEKIYGGLEEEES